MWEVSGNQTAGTGIGDDIGTDTARTDDEIDEMQFLFRKGNGTTEYTNIGKNTVRKEKLIPSRSGICTHPIYLCGIDGYNQWCSEEDCQESYGFQTTWLRLLGVRRSFREGAEVAEIWPSKD